MRRSSDRILVSHAGTLPRPERLAALLHDGRMPEFEAALPAAVAEVVRRQADMGIDIVNDGELSKTRGFSGYVTDRLSGLTEPAGDRPRKNVAARDTRDFPGFAAMRGLQFAAGRRGQNPPMICSGPIAYIGAEKIAADIARLKAAVTGLDVEAYMPAIAPGTVDHWLINEHYPDEESFLFAIADALHQEYKAITDAGLILQIDDPDLPDGWQIFPDMSLADYRKYADLRVAALNRALKGLPREQVRLHICWGSNHGPHKNDIPLEDIVDLVLAVPAGCYSVEAANPRHDHDWRVWQTTKLPDGATIMPGVVGHCTDIIEHPRLVADRLVKYANLVGRENVIAGTDCGIGSRVSHPEVAWAKLDAMVEGARLATKELWGR